MPRPASEDIAHEQVTDHRIQIPHQAGLRSVAEGVSNRGALTSIGDEKTTDRDAWAGLCADGAAWRPAEWENGTDTVAKGGNTGGGTAKDAELHTEVGFLEQESGDILAADREYRTALAADPDDGTAQRRYGRTLCRDR
jgi:hypothetical protein